MCIGTDFKRFRTKYCSHRKSISELWRYCKKTLFCWRKKDVQIYMVYTDNIVNGSAIEESILTNVMNRCRIDGKKEGLLKRLNEEVISIGEMQEVKTFQEIFDAVLLGDTILLMDENDIALQASTKGFPSRGVSEAKTEVVVQGPKDAFTEVGATNIVLIRRRIRDTKLKVKRTKVGQRSKTDVAILYMEDIVRQEILQEVEQKINAIDIDVILDSGYIDQLLENKWLSPFHSCK